MRRLRIYHSKIVTVTVMYETFFPIYCSPYFREISTNVGKSLRLESLTFEFRDTVQVIKI